MSNLKDNMMCAKATCPAKKSCARYSYNPPLGQSLYHPDPATNDHGSCDHFIANDELKGAVLKKKISDLPVLVHGVKVPAANQVKFFERKLKEARFREYGRQLAAVTHSIDEAILEASNITPPKYSDSHAEFADAFNTGALRYVERGHCTRMASDHTVAMFTGVANRLGVHIVVMAEDERTMLRGVSTEINEVMQANY